MDIIRLPGGGGSGFAGAYDAYIIVDTSSSATANGAALLAAYTAAKALTPNGAALSATNRAAVLIPPGKYDLGSGGELVLDTQFLDIVGLGERSDQHIVADHTETGFKGALRQTADNVRIKNLTLEATGVQSGDPSSAYMVDGNFPNTRMENVQLIGTDDNYAGDVNVLIQTDVSGLFVNVKTSGNGALFNNGHATSSMTLIDCYVAGSLCTPSFDGTAINVIVTGDAWGSYDAGVGPNAVIIGCIDVGSSLIGAAVDNAAKIAASTSNGVTLNSATTGAAPATSGTMNLQPIVTHGEVVTLTPTGACTFNMSGSGYDSLKGRHFTLIVTTSGSSSYNLTFGTGFKSQGVLATGTASGKTFTVTFLWTGSAWVETSRTTAM